MYATEQEDSPPVLFELSSCTICMQRLETDIATIKCGHVFHQECIRKCIRLSSKQCPVCKRRIQSEAEVNRLFLDYQENGKIELQLQKILDDLQTADVGANAFDRAITKLRKALQQKKQIQQKLDKISTQYVALQEKFENFVVGMKYMQQQIKESHVLRRKHEKKIKQLQQHNSFVQGQIQNYQKIIAQQQLNLKRYQRMKQTQDDTKKDNVHIDEMRKFILTTPQIHKLSEGVQYFSQLASGIKLDAKRLEKQKLVIQDKNKALELQNIDLRSEIQQCKLKYQKQCDLNKSLKQKYTRLHDKAYALLAKLNEKKIQTDIKLEEDNNSRKIVTKQTQVPRLMRKKDIVQNKPIQKNVFAGFNIGGPKRNQKKPSNNLSFNF